MAAAHLGHGLLTPFRRDQKNDFANGGGDALVSSSVKQIIGTRGDSPICQGELPWRSELGSVVPVLRHRQNDIGLQELTTHHSRTALRNWEPRVFVESVEAERLESNALVLRIRYKVIDRNMPNNQVLVEETMEI